MKYKIQLVACQGTQEEFNILRNLHRQCMKDNVIYSLGDWNDEQQHTRLKKHYSEYSKTLNFVYENDNLVGTINYHPKVFIEDGIEKSIDFFEQLYIHPNYQRQGIGQYLMSIFEKENTRLSVLRKDEKAQSFYRKLGYQDYKTDDFQVYFEKNTMKQQAEYINKNKSKII